MLKRTDGVQQPGKKAISIPWDKKAPGARFLFVNDFEPRLRSASFGNL